MDIFLHSCVMILNKSGLPWTLDPGPWTLVAHFNNVLPSHHSDHSDHSDHTRTIIIASFSCECIVLGTDTANTDPRYLSTNVTALYVTNVQSIFSMYSDEIDLNVHTLKSYCIVTIRYKSALQSLHN